MCLKDVSENIVKDYFNSEMYFGYLVMFTGLKDVSPTLKVYTKKGTYHSDIC